MKIFLTMFLSTVCAIAPTTAQAQGGPSREKVLRYIANGFKTCSGVSKVERQDSAFRVYKEPFLLEFDLVDFELPSSTDYGVILKCDMPGCISMYTNSPFDPKWTPMRSRSLEVLSCTGANQKINEAIEYFLENF